MAPDTFEEDFRDMLSLLNSNGVEFLVVGAHALAANHLPRATADLDLFVRPSQENAKRVIAALREFGAPLHGVTADDFSTPDVGLHIGAPPGRIDLLTTISGIDFENAASDAVSTFLLGVGVRALSIRALIQNKSNTGRSKDLEDVQRMRERQRDQRDLDAHLDDV